jgi:AAA domain-containing protein
VPAGEWVLDEDDIEALKDGAALQDTPVRYSDLVLALDSVGAPRNFFALGAIEGNPITLLSGPEKSHKSWTAIDLAVATTIADSWLGAYPIMRHGQVVYLDGEYGPFEFVRRVARVSRGHNQDPGVVVPMIRHLFSGNITLTPDDPYISILSKDIELNPPALIVIDPFRNHLVGSENDADVIVDAFRTISKLRGNVPCPVLVLHHLNKSGAASGHRAISTRADLIIEGTDGKDPVYSARGRTIRPRIDPIAEPFSIEVRHVNDEDDGIAETIVRLANDLGALELAILNAIRSQARTINWISRHLHRSAKDVGHAVDRLYASQRVETVKLFVNGHNYVGYRAI